MNKSLQTMQAPSCIYKQEQETKRTNERKIRNINKADIQINKSKRDIVQRRRSKPYSFASVVTFYIKGKTYDNIL